VRARDFVIFLAVAGKKKLSRRPFDFCMEQLKISIALNFFFHLDHVVRKLIDLGRKKQKELEQDLGRQKTNSKDYRFPPLSSVSSGSSVRKVSMGKRSDQELPLPPYPPATLTNSEKSHWL
jgi:hypothetical protein